MIVQTTIAMVMAIEEGELLHLYGILYAVLYFFIGLYLPIRRFVLGKASKWKMKMAWVGANHPTKYKEEVA